MYTHWVEWPQKKIWNKEYPPEIEFLYAQALPERENTDIRAYWNWFATPNLVQINIYDTELIVLFKLKYFR